MKELTPLGLEDQGCRSNELVTPRGPLVACSDPGFGMLEGIAQIGDLAIEKDIILILLNRVHNSVTDVTFREC